MRPGRAGLAMLLALALAAPGRSDPTVADGGARPPGSTRPAPNVTDLVSSFDGTANRTVSLTAPSDNAFGASLKP